MDLYYIIKILDDSVMLGSTFELFEVFSAKSADRAKRYMTERTKDAEEYILVSVL